MNAHRTRLTVGFCYRAPPPAVEGPSAASRAGSFFFLSAHAAPQCGFHGPGAEPGTTTASPTAPPAVLATTSVEPAVVAPGDKHFGAREEDFYPTEVHVAPPHGS